MGPTIHAWDPLDGRPPGLQLTPREDVQLWQASVPVSESALTSLRRSLSPDESARAERFTHDAARREYVFGRAFLRQLLGSALSIAPECVEFTFGRAGKPRVRPGSAPTDWRFNLAHSGGRVIIALAQGREVGVDLEPLQEMTDWPELAKRIFSPREQAELQALAGEQQPLAFFKGWTRKEAWLKATGEGLTEALAEIETTLAPDAPPAWRALPGGLTSMRHWSLVDLPLGANFAGALVYETTSQPKPAAAGTAVAV